MDQAPTAADLASPSSSPARIVDCFLYVDQSPYRELLELRLALLGDVVDRFVIVCSQETFSGQTLPTLFPHDAPVVQMYRDRIELVVLEGLQGSTSRSRERFVRNAIRNGLGSARPNDLVMIGDIDELPRPEIAKALCDGPVITRPVLLGLDYFNFKFNYRLLHGVQALWAGPVVTSYAHLGEPDALRQSRWAILNDPDRVIHRAGWHFSFLTATDDVQAKLRSMFVPHEREWHGFPDGSRSDNRISVSQLVQARQGFHDHMYAGSVWAQVPLTDLRCETLEALITAHPDFLLAGKPDDPAIRHQRVALAMWQLYDREIPKVLYHATDAQLLRSGWSRLRNRARRLLRRR